MPPLFSQPGRSSQLPPNEPRHNDGYRPEQRRVTTLTTTPLPARPEGQSGFSGALASPITSTPLSARPEGRSEFSGALALPSNEKDPAGDEWLNYLGDKWKGARMELTPPMDEENYEDDSEEDASMGCETEELQEPIDTEPPEHSRQRKLDRDQVTSIINDFIAKYTASWRPGLHYDEDFDQAFDEHELWHEFYESCAEERQRLIEETKANIATYGRKLDYMGDEISKEEWRSPAALRQQCLSLEAIIEQLEQEKWELSVYELPSPPPRINYAELEPLPTFPKAPAFPKSSQRGPDAFRADQHGDFDAAYVVNSNTSIQAPAMQSKGPIEIIDLGSSPEPESGEEQQFFSADEHITDHPVTEKNTIMPMDLVIMPSDPMVIDSVEPRSSPPPHATNSQKRRTPQSPPPMEVTPPPPQSSVNPRERPDDASYATVSRWQWDDLIESADRQRIIMKVLQEMPSADLSFVRSHITLFRKRAVISELGAVITMLRRGDTKLPGYPNPEHRLKVVKFAKLFLCWWFADDYYNEAKGNEVPMERLEELEAALKDGSSRDPDFFCDWLHFVLEHTFSEEALKNLWAPSQGEIIVISDDEGPAVPFPSSRKEKKGERKPADSIKKKV